MEDYFAEIKEIGKKISNLKKYDNSEISTYTDKLAELNMLYELYPRKIKFMEQIKKINRPKSKFLDDFVNSIKFENYSISSSRASDGYDEGTSTDIKFNSNLGDIIFGFNDRNDLRTYSISFFGCKYKHYYNDENEDEDKDENEDKDEENEDKDEEDEEDEDEDEDKDENEDEDDDNSESEYSDEEITEIDEKIYKQFMQKIKTRLVDKNKCTLDEITLVLDFINQWYAFKPVGYLNIGYDEKYNFKHMPKNEEKVISVKKGRKKIIKYNSDYDEIIPIKTEKKQYDSDGNEIITAKKKVKNDK